MNQDLEEEMREFLEGLFSLTFKHLLDKYPEGRAFPSVNTSTEARLMAKRITKQMFGEDAEEDQ